MNWKLTVKNKLFYFYVIFTVLALYTHYFSFFIISAQAIYIIYLNRDNLNKYKPYLAGFALIGILYLLWIRTFYEHITRGQSWRTSQTILQVLNEYVNYLKDMSLGLYYHYTDLTIIKYITIFLLIMVVFALTGLFIRRKDAVRNNSVVLILLLSFVPLILAGIISFRQKVEFYRYLSIIIPYILIFLVYGISKWKNKIITYTVLGYFTLINIYGLNIHYSVNFKNDDYRQLIYELDRNYKPGERIYAEPHYNGWIIDYYAMQEKLKVPKTVYIRYGWNEILDSINTQKPERFWVIFDYSSVDTSKYSAYKSDLNNRFIKDTNITYQITPSRVEVYRFKSK